MSNVKLVTSDTLSVSEVLRVTADGEFIWHPEADAMIEGGDFSSSPAMPHILRQLRRITELEAQNAQLLEALKYALDWVDAVANGTPLPPMPGFDRDWVDGVIAAAEQAQGVKK